MTWQRSRNRVRFVNEDEILIHPFRIDRTLIRRTPEDKTCAFTDFESLVLLLVHLEREVSAFAHDEIFFHAWVFVQRNRDAAPTGANHAVVRVLDPIQ